MAKKCIICGQELLEKENEFGNNPYPIFDTDAGLCCNRCNALYVSVARKCSDFDKCKRDYGAFIKTGDEESLRKIFKKAYSIDIDCIEEKYVELRLFKNLYFETKDELEACQKELEACKERLAKYE